MPKDNTPKKVIGLPPKPADYAIQEGTPIWNDTADAIAKVVKAHEDYIKAVKAKGVAEDKAYRLSDRSMRQFVKLRRHLVKMRTEGGQFGQAMSGLASKMGGGPGLAGSLSRFAGAFPKALTHVDKGTGTMMAFTKSLGMSAAKFNAYTAAVQISIGALVKFLDYQDKVRIRTARIMKEFGASGEGITINPGDPERISAKGIDIAGSTGEEAAKSLYSALFKMRVPIEEIQAIKTGKGENDDAFGDLTRLTAGGLSKTPEYLTKLRGTFAKRGNLDEMVKIITEMGIVAHASGVPLEQFIDNIFQVGTELLSTGASFEEVAGMLSNVGDAVGKLELPMQLAVNFIKESVSEIHTAGGVEKLATAAMFTDRMWDKLPKDITENLDKFTKTLPGAKGKGFRDLDILDRSQVFRELHGQKNEWADFRGKLFIAVIDYYKEQLGWGAGEAVARKLALMLTGQELKPLRDVVEKTGASAPLSAGSKMTAKEAAEAIKKGDIVGVEFDTHIRTISDLQVEWYSAFKSAWNRLWADIIEIISGTSIEEITAEAKQAALFKILSPYNDTLSTLSPTESTKFLEGIGGKSLLSDFVELGTSQSNSGPIMTAEDYIRDYPMSDKHRQRLKDMTPGGFVEFDSSSDGSGIITIDTPEGNTIIFDVSATFLEGNSSSKQKDVLPMDAAQQN